MVTIQQTTRNPIFQGDHREGAVVPPIGAARPRQTPNSDTQLCSQTPHSLSWKEHRRSAKVVLASSHKSACMIGKSPKREGSCSDRACRVQGAPHLSETHLRTPAKKNNMAQLSPGRTEDAL